ncbi:MAG: hypothetical protein WA160_00640 [Pseudobdellovibrio sp.]
MQSIVNFKLQFNSILAFSLVIVSCTTTPEIKTVHNDSVEMQPVLPEPLATAKPLKMDAAKLALKTSPLTNIDLQKYAYELGIDPKNALTDEEHIMVERRRKVRILERSLDSQKERLNYSKVLPWLENDEEKINYLSIPSIEGRLAWVNKNKIWLRNKNVKDYQAAVESQDIALGMPADFVKKSWGEPDSIENSGNPIYKNERWKYIKQVSTSNGYHQEKRYVYIEGGRVVGWETE